MKNTFSISEAISFGWNKFWSNWKFWVVATLLVGAARMGSGASFSAPAGSNGGDFVNNLKNSTPMMESELMDSMDSLESGMLESQTQNFEMTDEPKEVNTNVFGVATKRVLGDQDQKVSPVLVGVGIAYGVVIFVFMFIFALLAILANIVLRMGFINLKLDAARDKELGYKTLLNQVSFKKAIRLATAQFLAGLITMVGFIFLIIPGFYFLFRYMFVSYVVVDEDVKILEALKRSSQITKGVKFKLFLFLLVFVGMFLLGMVAFGVGVYIVTVVMGLALAHVYVQLVDSAPKPALENVENENQEVQNQTN